MGEIGKTGSVNECVLTWYGVAERGVGAPRDGGPDLGGASARGGRSAGGGVPECTDRSSCGVANRWDVGICCMNANLRGAAGCLHG